MSARAYHGSLSTLSASLKFSRHRAHCVLISSSSMSAVLDAAIGFHSNSPSFISSWISRTRLSSTGRSCRHCRNKLSTMMSVAKTAHSTNPKKISVLPNSSSNVGWVPLDLLLIDSQYLRHTGLKENATHR